MILTCLFALLLRKNVRVYKKYVDGYIVLSSFLRLFNFFLLKKFFKAILPFISLVETLSTLAI